MKHADEETQAYRQEAMAKVEKEAGAVLDSARNRAQKIVNDAMERAASEEKQIVQNAQSEIARLSVEADPETDGLQTVRRVRSVP